MNQIFNEARLRILERRLIDEQVNRKSELILRRKYWCFNPYSGDKVCLFAFAVDETVKLFPSHWAKQAGCQPVFVEDEHKHVVTSLTSFFGINSYMLLHLMSPGRQLTEIYGGVQLTSETKPSEIAYNIFSLICFVSHLTTPEYKHFNLN